MIVVIGGRVYQWDTGRKVRITPENNASIAEVHYYYEGDAEGYCVETTNDGDAVIAPIPNILLQENRTIEICAVSITDDGLRTMEIVCIRVFARSKPPNYIYTETEALNVEIAVRNALTKAKESGEFKGEKGDPGKDYILTENDKTEIVNTVLNAIPNGDEEAY